MKYFVTGASGFIGSAVTTELIKNGHQVVGLARSDKSAEIVKGLGAEVIRGDLSDLEALKKGASTTDGVAHLGFIHDFTNFQASCETDRLAIEAMSSVMHGTNKPLVASFGVLFLPNDHPATENDFHPLEGMISFRAKNEAFLLQEAKNGVASMAIRLCPTVHGKGDHGFMSLFVAAAKKNGKSPYVGDGANQWPAVGRADAARLYRLALENPKAGTVLHAVQEQGIPWTDIATTIGKKLNVPVVSIQAGPEAVAHFGVLGHFVGAHNPVSGALTQEKFNWKPEGPGLLADLEEGHYFSGEVTSKYL